MYSHSPTSFFCSHITFTYLFLCYVLGLELVSGSLTALLSYTLDASVSSTHTEPKPEITTRPALSCTQATIGQKKMSYDKFARSSQLSRGLVYQSCLPNLLTDESTYPGSHPELEFKSDFTVL